MIRYLLLCPLILLLAGCSAEGPDEPLDDAVASPDDLMARFAAALTAGDAAALAPLIDHETGRSYFVFRQDDVDSLGLPTSSLGGGETIDAFRNIFSGLPVQNQAGETVPAVESILIDTMERLTEWSGPSPGDDLSWWELRFNVQKVSHRVEYTVTRAIRCTSSPMFMIPPIPDGISSRR